ncbi:hypothetical protein [uncultured Pseudodesulfovibrio sp.]|uniref:hypothetical protein n=1 Tax=uncultured Pseudodesulfovibrio sp. TaxID=2035858 RepID=UPI0029C8F741|nr:hypothetical protein [uncultured Pseudodesulfovibrio sp.]
MRKYILILIVCLLFCSGCAKVVHSTTSGKPEVLINRPYSQEMVDSFEDMMVEREYITVSTANNTLIFQKELTNPLAIALLSSNGRVRAHIEFKMVEMHEAVRVIASPSFITNPGDEYENHIDQSNHRDTKKLQEEMTKLKARLESLPMDSYTPMATDLTTTSVVSTDDIRKGTLTNEPPATYNPNGKVEIILVHKSSDNYAHCFVKEPGSYNQIKDWGRYSMLRGYIVSDEPIEKSFQNYYEIKLQTGESIFYKVDTDEEIDSNFGIADVMWYDEYLERMDNVGKPLVEGAATKLISYERKYGSYQTSTGKTVYSGHLDNIRRFVSTLTKNKVKVAETLLDYDIEYKEFDDKFFIDNREGYKTSVSVYIGRIKKKVWGRFKLTYHASDWLFINQFGVVADGYRYDSNRIEFDRDNSDKIWETADQGLNKSLYSLASKISKSKKSIIRFYGKEGTKDFTVPRMQKKKITDILELYQLIKSSV